MMGKIKEKPLGEPLSLKQKLWVDAYVETGNATAAARTAKYKGTNGSLGVIGCENLKRLKAFIRKKLDETSLNDERVDIVLSSALEAKETKFFQHEGKVISRRNVANWAVRLRAVDMYNRIKARYQDSLRLSGTMDLIEMDEKQKARTRRQAQIDARMEIERSYRGE